MSKIFYDIKQSFVQMWRNKGMSLASIFAITAMLLILGIFFVISVNVNMFTESIKDDYNTVEVFMLDDASDSVTEQDMLTLQKINGVSEVGYRTKEQALEILKQRWGDNGYLLDSLEDNPLPNSIIVTIDDVDAANEVYEVAGKLDGVESIKYYKDTVDKLTRFTKFLKIGCGVVMVFLVIISIVVVSNTIKLTVFARSKEISIMKYVGATNWFIRVPFMIEGITIGIVSALISALITFVIYARIVAAIGNGVTTMFSFSLVSPSYLITNLIIIFLAIGVGIGASGSIVSMRKFLDA